MIQQPAIHGRFAPSPSGPLHFGSIVAALGSWCFAKKHAGLWTLRIEDVDHDRCDHETGLQQIRDLESLGMLSDTPIEWQSENDARYINAIDQLLRDGHAFRCVCSRADVASMGGIHRACIRHARDDEPASIRLHVPANTHIAFDDLVCGKLNEDVAQAVGDFVLRRADGQFTYQLAVVVDDAHQGINQVVRGADLLESTARQIFLQQRLGYATPSYAHLPLIRNKDGAKLSKRLDDPRAFDIENDPVEILTAAWVTLNQKPINGITEPTEWLQKATDAFDFRRIPATEP